MAALTTQVVVNTGLEATYASAAGGGDTFTNTGKELIHIRNGSGGDITLTIETSLVIEGDLTVADRTVLITAGEERFVGPFKTSRYGATTTLTYSGVTSLDLAVLQMTNEV